MSKIIPFFATQEDLNSLMQKIAEECELIFTPSGIFEEQKPILFSSWQESSGSSFLVLKKNTVVHSEKIERVDGVIVYAVNQRLNQDSLSLVPSRELSQAHLLAGSAGIGTDSEDARALFELFRKHIQKSFRKVRSYYVGEGAYIRLSSGGRLSSTEFSPREYDLNIL